MAKTARRQIENSVANAAQNSAKIIGDGANRELTIAIQKIARKDFDAMDHFLNEQAETSVAGFAFLADHNVQTYFGGVSRIAIIEDKSIRLFPRSKDLLRNFEHYTREVESAWDIMDVNFSHAPTSVREYFERLKACASVGDLKNAQMEAHENIFYASFDEYAEDKRDVQLDIIRRIQKIESLATANGTETEEKEMTNQKNNGTLDNYPSIKKEFDDLEQAVATKAIEVISIKHPSRKLTENDLKREINRIFPNTRADIDYARDKMLDFQCYRDGDVYWIEDTYDDDGNFIRSGNYWTRIEREMIGEARPESEMTRLLADFRLQNIEDLIDAEAEKYLTSEEKEPSDGDASDSSSDIMIGYFSTRFGSPAKHEINLKFIRRTWRSCLREFRQNIDKHNAREAILATIAAAKISDLVRSNINYLLDEMARTNDSLEYYLGADQWLYRENIESHNAELDAIQAKLNRYAYQIFK